MKKWFVFCCFVLLSACQSVRVPADFVYHEIKTSTFTIASWQKVTNPDAGYRVYIEGDGAAFNANGLPSNNPTPHGVFMRDICFKDDAPNVVYLARPCQYVKDDYCNVAYWTTKRFAPEVVEAEYAAVEQITKGEPVTLIGFSGGAQIAGLITVLHPKLNVQKVITIAGNLDHKAWTDYHKLPALDGSLNLKDYKKAFAQIPQKHFVGEKDKVIPPVLTEKFVAGDKIVVVKGASHAKGWDEIYQEVYEQ